MLFLLFINMADKTDPLKGITAKLSNRATKLNCSLAVSIVCDTNGVQVRACFLCISAVLFSSDISSDFGL